jgi:dipeptidyl aminopeptidase/acylaminoacyl peptidase
MDVDDMKIQKSSVIGMDGNALLRQIGRLIMVIVAALVCCGSIVAQDDGGLVVAWIQDGAVMAWSGGEVRTVAEGDAITLYVAPEGERLAFTRGEEGLPATLWTVNVDGTDEQQIEAQAYLWQVVWGDADTVYFNTLELGALGATPRDDLYSVAVDTNTVTEIVPGGSVSVNTDGSALAIVASGIYGELDGTVSLMDTESGAVVEALTFPAIASGSHFKFYPDVWAISDGSFRVALPDADAIYAEGSPNPPEVALWRIGADGAAERIGGARASFFGLPAWSSDGATMVYLERGNDPNRFSVYVADGDGSDATLYTSGDAATIQLPQWRPDSAQFVFVQDGALRVGTGNEPPRTLVEIDGVLAPTVIVSETSVIYQRQNPDTNQWELWSLGFEDGEATLIAEVGEALRVFDATEGG